MTYSIDLASIAKNFGNEGNISVDGWLWIHKNKFYFEHKYYSWTYYGSEHSFHIDSNGKAKQIKNHKIEITNYEKTGDNEYKVISWEFVK